MTDIDWTNLPALSTLRAFEATARLQGYSAAARSLNVTPAAIAQQVRKLERETGLALVQREGRGLVTTAIGQRFADTLSTAFQSIAQGLEDAKLHEATRGLRVSTTDFFANVIILPALGSFWQQHPEIQVSFAPEGNTAPVDLDAFDVVIRGGPPGQTWDEFDTTPLLQTPMILCAAPELLGPGPPDVSQLPWIKDRGIGGGVFEEAVQRAGCDPAEIQLVDPGSAKLEPDATLMGLGIHFGPEIMVRKELTDGALVKLPINLDMDGVYYALTRQTPQPGPVRAFLGWLENLCDSPAVSGA